MAISLGQTVMGMWLWDLMRLADYALTCDCVSGHISCVGFSGGGMQSLLINYNCHCNYVPNLWKTADIGDIGALICPRPVLIETGNRDSLNGKDGLHNVLPQVETVRRAMALFGCEDRLYHDIFEGEHRWHGKMAYRWLLSHTPPNREERR